MRPLLFLLLALPFAAGCDGTEPNPPGGAAQTYVGTLAGGASGALSVTTSGTTATGQVTVIGKTAMPSLSGSFNPTTGALTLTGGGYSFTGTLSGSTLTGTWTGPNGTSGSFTATLSGSGADQVTVYCGTFAGNVESGTLNIVRRGSSLLGFAVPAGASSGTALEGSVSGNAVSVWRRGDATQTVLAQGTISGDTVSGTFSGGSNSGTWQASVCTP